MTWHLVATFMQSFQLIVLGLISKERMVRSFLRLVLQLVMQSINKIDLSIQRIQILQFVTTLISSRRVRIHYIGKMPWQFILVGLIDLHVELEPAPD